MTDIVIANCNVDQTLDLVRGLRQQGFVQGQDFDFVYKPARYDYDKSEYYSPQARFMFYRPAAATWFALTKQ
jgi:hypothetical protein